jgi:ribosome biogenesis GTPase A
MITVPKVSILRFAQDRPSGRLWELLMQSKNSRDNQLRQYIFAKQQVSDLVRQSMQLFERLNVEARVDSCRELLVKLAEDRFNLAVVGQFKRGKSSLMNAIIGRDLLPTGLLPLTSAITALCYGPKEKVVLKRMGWVMDHEIELQELPNYVTEQGNPGNQKGVIEARIEMPTAFLRRGLYFVDTPGIGSTRQANTATTYDFLPRADAVVFVTSVEAPLSEAEETFLRDIQEYVRRLFVVVNKIDLVSPQERDQVLRYIHSGLSTLVEGSNIQIYPLSARNALQAKLEDDAQALEASGLPAFEKTLESFLAEEKANTLLISILDDLAAILVDTSDGKEISSLRARFHAVQEELLKGSLPAGPQTMPDLLTPPKASVEIKKVLEAKPVQSLRKTRTCPICDALSRAVFDFFVSLEGNLVKEVQVRNEFAFSRGLCNLHTWQFQNVAAPQDISVGYVPLVEMVAASLKEIANGDGHAEAVTYLLSKYEHCPACEALKKEQDSQAALFLEYISTPDGQKFYRQSLGLCLPHLRVILVLHPEEKIARFLLDEQAEHFNDLADDMRSYTLKRDAIRRGLMNTNEENAWRRALVQLVGERTAHIP